MNAPSYNLGELLEACRTRTPAWISDAFDIGAADLDLLSTVVRGPITIDKGHDLCAEDAPCDALCIVRTGAFKSYITRHDGDPQITGLRREMLRMLSQRIREGDLQLLTVTKKPSSARLALYLLLAHRKQGASGAQPVLYLPMTRDDLANFLSLASETLSRLIARFEGEGLIEIPDRQHVTILDLEGLNRLARVSDE